MPSPPTLVILRGNSGSGKSVTARRVQRALPRGEVAVIGQDAVRREVLWEHDTPEAQTPGLLAVMVRHCLARGRTTILEGILDAERYGATIGDLIDVHEGPTLIYYLDVSLAETLRRHATKPIAADVSVEEVASWYRHRDLLIVPGEEVLGEHLLEEELVGKVLEDLSSCGL